MSSAMPEAVPNANRRSATLLTAGGAAMTILFAVYTTALGSTPAEVAAQASSARLPGLLLGLVPGLLIGFGIWGLRRRITGAEPLAWVACTTIALVFWVSVVLDLLFQGLAPPFALLVLAPAVAATAFTMRPQDLPQRIARWLLAGLAALLLVALVLIFVPGSAPAQLNGYRVFGVLAYGIPGLLWTALGLVFRTLDRPTAQEVRRA